eukprot:gene9778-21827_t
MDEWERDWWESEWITRPEAEDLLKKLSVKSGSFIARPYGDQKPDAWIISLIFLEAGKKSRSLVHLLIERDGPDSPYTCNGDPIGSCRTIDSVVETLRELGDGFEFPLRWPLFLKESGTDEPEVIDDSHRVSIARKPSVAFTDTKAVPCLL